MPSLNRLISEKINRRILLANFDKAVLESIKEYVHNEPDHWALFLGDEKIPKIEVERRLDKDKQFQKLILTMTARFSTEQLFKTRK
jgi:hypothetical protein